MVKRWFICVLVGVLVSGIVFSAEVWAINWRFLVATKFSAITTTIDSFKGSFPLSSQISIIVLAILAGIYASLFAFHLRNRYLWGKTAGLGLAGSVFGTFGVGCGACGSVALSTVFGGGATAAFLAILPFKGVEFSGIGILIIAVGIYLLVAQIRKPIVCRK